jgi:hypothetical protein
MTHLHGHNVGISLGLRLPRTCTVKTIFSWKMYIGKKVVFLLSGKGIF